MDENDTKEISDNAAPKVDDAAKETVEETAKDEAMTDIPSATATATVDVEPTSAGTKREASDAVEEEEPPKKKPALESINNDKAPAMPKDAIAVADKTPASEPTIPTSPAKENEAATTATEEIVPPETPSSVPVPSEAPVSASVNTKDPDATGTQAPPKTATAAATPAPAPVPETDAKAKEGVAQSSSVTENNTRSETAAATATKTSTTTVSEKKQERPPPAKPATSNNNLAKPATTGRKKEPAPSTTATASAKASSSGARATTSTSKKSTTEQAPKSLKGLRHFSMMVCKKVEEKGQTTYNEVADELVKQVIESRKREDAQGKFDEKNIRRRVYDSINVLLAMDIISKDKKQISWKGLPTMAHHDIQLLEREEQARKEQVQAKRLALQELLVQQICFRNLVRRNKKRQVETLHAEKVPMPFLVVNTHKKAIVNCNMAPDMKHAMFEFDHSFEINDDNSILKRLGMHRTTVPELKQIVPEDMITYCQEHGLLDDALGDNSEDADTPLGLTSVGSNRGQYFQSLD